MPLAVKSAQGEAGRFRSIGLTTRLSSPKPALSRGADGIAGTQQKQHVYSSELALPPSPLPRLALLIIWVPLATGPRLAIPAPHLTPPQLQGLTCCRVALKGRGAFDGERDNGVRAHGDVDVAASAEHTQITNLAVQVHLGMQRRRGKGKHRQLRPGRGGGMHGVRDGVVDVATSTEHPQITDLAVQVHLRRANNRAGMGRNNKA